ncbi:MAG: STAS domain-containing protein [Jiangellales bacterium]
MGVVRPSVNLDVAGAQQLERALNEFDEDVEIDLSDVKFVASSGLRVMLKAAQRLKKSGHSVTVSGANDTGGIVKTCGSACHATC